MEIWVVLYILGGLVALVIGGEFLVRGSSGLAVALGIAPIVIGLTIVAFGTSAPELAVSLAAAFRGNADIAIANVIGSNIFNTLLILGMSALIVPLTIHSTIIRREVPVLIALSIALFLMVQNGRFDRWEGMLFVASAIGYTWWLVQSALAEKSRKKEEAGEEATEAPSGGIPKLLGFIVLGLGAIMLGADWLVQGASSLARTLGVSDTVIGLTIVSVGTSLPEVVASITAAIKGERDIAVGNVIGSNIYNLAAILGIAGAVMPSGLAVEPGMLSFDIPLWAFLALLCFPAFYFGRVLTKGRGAIFLAGYIAYTTYIVIRATS